MGLGAVTALTAAGKDRARTSERSFRSTRLPPTRAGSIIDSKYKRGHDRTPRFGQLFDFQTALPVLGPAVRLGIQPNLIISAKLVRPRPAAKAGLRRY